MENSLYIALSRQISLANRMNLVANNIANVNTPGFKSEHMLFVEETVETDAGIEVMSFVNDYGQFTKVDQGPVKLTGNPLDVALEGTGFFAVETATGTKYTRAGNFKLNNENVLVTANGMPVLSDGEDQIEIPEGATSISIGQNGSIMADGSEVGRLMIAEFENIQELNPTGHGLYETEQEPFEPENPQTRVVQGSLEMSNVNSILEMTDMIEISRQYQSTQRLMQNEHDRMRSAITKLSEVQ
jgi:flagellar basal-body rod protein FlgF